MQNKIMTQVIQSAIEVHRQLGRGMTQATYLAAVKHELHERGVTVSDQKMLDVYYKGQSIAETQVDLWVPLEGKEALLITVFDDPKYEESSFHQMMSLLKATEQAHGMVLNFSYGKMVEGIRKVSKTYKPKD